MKNFVIGVTGNMGSGKTTFCNLLQKYGYNVFNTDNETKNLYSSKKIQQLIKTTFKVDNVTKETLRKIVFSNKNKKFQNLIHPFVMSYFKKWCKDKKNIVIESAILFETGIYKDIDFIVYLDVLEEERIKRCLKRGMQLCDIENRMKYQYKRKFILQKIKSKPHYIMTNVPIEQYTNCIKQINYIINSNEKSI